MNDLCTVVLHLLGDVLNVPAGAAVTGCKPDKLHIFSFIPFKSAFAVAQSPHAFSPGTGPVPVADDDSQFNGISHGLFSELLNFR
jgi:hypothetical protein